MPVAPPADFSFSIIHGPCSVYVGFNNSPLAYLGITQDGGRFALNWAHGIIQSDAAGPEQPAELQNFGRSASIAAKLTAISYDTLEDIIRVQSGLSDGDNDGSEDLRGAAMAASGMTYRVVFSSQIRPYRFNCCKLVSPSNFDMGTKASAYDFNWYAWAPPKLESDGTLVINDLYDHEVA